MARVRWTLCCRPEPIARVMQLFPKLALLFLIIHVAGMIYTVTRPAYAVKLKENKIEAAVPPTRSFALAADHQLTDTIRQNKTLHSNTRNETESILLNILKQNKLPKGEKINVL